MTIESATHIEGLNRALPSASDFVKEGDNHLNLIKSVLKNTFPGASKPFDLNEIENRALNYSVPAGMIMFWGFDGASIPAGWGVCDGTVYNKLDGSGPITSPDLINRFIRGTEQGGFIPPRGTGGQDSVVASTTSVNNHTHGASATGAAGGHSHGGTTQGFALTINHMPWHDHGGGGHNHSVGINRYTSVGGTFNNSFAGETIATTTDTYTTDWKNVVTGQGGGWAHAHPIDLDGNHSHTIPVTVPAGGHSHTATVTTLPKFTGLIPLMKL